MSRRPTAPATTASDGKRMERTQVLDMMGTLKLWPAASRNGAHAVALNACKAGIAGDIDPETVRSTLVAIARRHVILVPDMVSLAPAALAAGGSRTSNSV